MSDALDFRLLGPIEVARNGASVSLGGRRQRALLALLLVEPGLPVSVDRLVEELWQGRPPPGAAATLRAYASKLRGALGPDAELTSGPFGYALAVASEQVDAQRFERLAREGEEALAAGGHRRARRHLHEALLQWRGRPFGGLGDDGVLKEEAARLEQRRVDVLEQRISADLALGAGVELVEEVETLVREHPYRERLWRALMLALYRAERQTDALGAFRRARALLAEVGLEPTAELRQLEQAILRHEVPEPEQAAHHHNLPAPLTSFVGRETEIDQIERILADARLLTLTGVGGVGKTRLGLEVAWRVLESQTSEVRFVDFSPVTRGADVARAVADAIELPEEQDRAPLAVLVDHLRAQEALLLLDNCEHVLDACAELVDELLRGCPRLQILATSREQLPVAGAVDFPVPPFRLPPPGADPATAHGNEAVRLLLARAREARPQLDADASLASAVAICRELDGLPLAIELAAARAKALTLDEIAARLADRFRFLVSWRRLTAARHRTLREAMDWSFELLSEPEQQLLAGLSVFVDGFTLGAVARVFCEGREEEALVLVGRLVDASLVVAEERGGAMRYHLLETVRRYAAERLAESGRPDDARSRHAAWAVELAEEAQAGFAGSEQTEWFEIVDRERENLRAALEFGSEGGESEHGLRLAVALSRYWYVRGQLAEGRSWLERALAAADFHPNELSRRAFTAAASLALLQGDYEVATGFGERALDAARAGDDPVRLANALSNLGAIVLAAGDSSRARELLEEAVELARAAGDRRVAALAINNLGDLALTTGDYAGAEPLFEESLSLLRELGDTANVARSLFNLGAVALSLGRASDAGVRFRESVELAEAAGDKEDIAWCLEGFAGVAAAAGSGEHAAMLLGAAGALLAEIGAEFKPFERQLDERTRSEGVRLCGEEAFAEALARGETLPLESALSLARSRAD